MAVRKPVTSRSTITSSICDRPVSSHRIRLLVPAARPSTTTSVREVARVSITVGLLDRTRVIGACAAAGTGATPCAGLTAGASVAAGSCCAAPFRAAGNNANRTTRPAIFAALELFISCPHRFCPPLRGPASDRMSPSSKFLLGPLTALNYFQSVDRLDLGYPLGGFLALDRRMRGSSIRRQLFQARGAKIDAFLINAAAQHKLN